MDRLKRERYFSFVLMAAAVAFGLWRLRYGVSFSDEGHSLGAPLRYLLGDSPFRDEVANPLRFFDIALAPVISILPDEGTVLLLRAAAFLFQIACFGAFAYVLCGRSGPVFFACSFAAGLHATSFGFWTPTYHSVSTCFMLLCMALLVKCENDSSAIQRKTAAFFAGISLFCASFCELPFAALAAVLVFFGFAPSFYKNSEYRSFYVYRYAAGVFVVFAAVAAFAFASSGIYPDFLNAFSTLRTVGEYDAGLAARLVYNARIFLVALPLTALIACGWAAAAAPSYFSSTGKRQIPALKVICWFVVPALVAAVSFYIIAVNLKFAFHISSAWYEAYAIFAVVVFVVSVVWGRWETASERMSFMAVSVMTFAWHVVLLFICSNGAVTASLLTMPAAIIVTAAGMKSIEWRIVSPDGTKAGTSAGLASMLLCTALVIFGANLYSSSESDWVWKLESKFKSGRLAGIYSTEQKVVSTELTVEYLSQRVSKGETLLVFYENPMLHFLTGTRAAMPTGFLTRHWPEATRERFVREMVERGRVPGFAVSYGGVVSEPVYDFVSKHYVPEARFSQYVVWKRYR